MPFILSRRSDKTLPRVTPDDDQADALRRKLAALDYVPANGFHKDRKQTRIGRVPPSARWHKPVSTQQ